MNGQISVRGIIIFFFTSINAQPHDDPLICNQIALYVLDRKQVTGSGLLNDHPVTIQLQLIFRIWLSNLRNAVFKNMLAYTCFSAHLHAL